MIDCFYSINGEQMFKQFSTQVEYKAFIHEMDQKHGLNWEVHHTDRW